MKADDVNIQTVFNRSRHLDIPFFQRAYVWGKENNDLWDRFLEDIKTASNNNEKYFMGVIILKQTQTSASDQVGDVRVVIDGQQRLTTLILLFKALYEINGSPEKFKENFYTNYGDLILRHNRIDREKFEKILEDIELTKQDKESCIYKCYNYFKENIEKDEIDPNKVFQNITFVLVELREDEDEQQIFDSINSLGMSLTAAELLKNYLFKEDEEKYKVNWEEVFEDKDKKTYWDMKVTSGRNIRTNLDLFLESYLTIKIQDKAFKIDSRDKKSLLKIQSVFDSYKKLIEKHSFDKEELISELREYAKIYRSYINPLIVDQDTEDKEYIKRINLVIFGLNTTTIIPYILYVAKNSSEQDRKDIFRYIESYLIRRLIIKETSKNYNNLFRESFINKKICLFVDLKDFIENKTDKSNFMPTDEQVRSGINESRLNNYQARGVLYLIETAIRGDMHSTEIKSMNSFSLEHLMPKNWRKNWKASSFSDEMKKERDRALRTLGNLILLDRRLNSSISDSDWKTKKEGKGRHGGLKQYATGMDTFNPKYIEKKDWNEEAIKERARELSEKAINEVWKING